jgi:hypothetical protein
LRARPALVGEHGAEAFDLGGARRVFARQRFDEPLQGAAGVAAIAEVEPRAVERRGALIAVFEHGGVSRGEVAMGRFERGESGGRLCEPAAAGLALDHKLRNRQQEGVEQALEPLEVIERRPMSSHYALSAAIGAPTASLALSLRQATPVARLAGGLPVRPTLPNDPGRSASRPPAARPARGR